MKLQTRYGGFTATVNSRIAAFVALVLLPRAAVTAPANVHAQSEPIKLAILGDSLAAGYGLAPAQAFPGPPAGGAEGQGA
jgi:acyl-CoA thioesterase-1